MLKHHNEKPAPPRRVVLLGGSGFLGQALAGELSSRKIAAVSPSSKELDLTDGGAAAKLAALLHEDDTLVMLSALTPDRGRDTGTLMRNLRMAEAVGNALAERPVAHVVYVSSDAVYPFREGLVSETTPAEPGDLYGVMHRARELMLQAACPATPFAVLRPTLLYGAGDTHNSYGPNRFRRLAAQTGRITLGGEGEETRDHLYVSDAARLIAEVLEHRSAGLLNLASGHSVSFREAAERVASCFAPPAEVAGSPRNAPVTHRSFDITNRVLAFPHFHPTPLEEGLALSHAGEAGRA